MNDWLLLLVFAAGWAAAAWMGYRAGRAAGGGAAERAAPPAQRRARGAFAPAQGGMETDAERCARIIAQNIENYGTPAPQREVE